MGCLRRPAWQAFVEVRTNSFIITWWKPGQACLQLKSQSAEVTLSLVPALDKEMALNCTLYLW